MNARGIGEPHCVANGPHDASTEHGRHEGNAAPYADCVISVLAGGVGAARFLRGLVQVTDATSVTAIVNTADDTELHGLSISPDIDTVIYTISDNIDRERGWGLRSETWRAMEALERFAHVRPPGSSAAPRWFNLGDTDLATHFYRTARLHEGATLAEVTDEIARAFDAKITVRPMTNDRVRTMVETTQGWLPFQEYFVRLRHDVTVRDVRFDGSESARFIDPTLISDCDGIVIAPSNPVVSIGPIRALAGVDDVLASRRDSVVAISPIVAGSALKGPADRMLTELGHEASVVGVAKMYAPVCGTLIIDEQDADLADAVRAQGVACVVTKTIMSQPGVSASLAQAVLDVLE